MPPIDFTEQFPHLTNAPIAEATVDIRVTPSANWDDKKITEELKKRFPDYPKIEMIREASFEIATGASNKMAYKDGGCVGFKLTSGNNFHIAQFNKAAFVFSRLKPYEDWERFTAEAFRLWGVYQDLLPTKIITRLGLRFINRMSVPGATLELSDYYQNEPTFSKETDWPLTGFLHHDIVAVPETPYQLNLIKTVQNTVNDVGLILDIDVYHRDSFSFDQGEVLAHFEKMRFIKNKTFFSNVTTEAIKRFL